VQDRPRSEWGGVFALYVQLLLRQPGLPVIGHLLLVTINSSTLWRSELIQQRVILRATWWNCSPYKAEIKISRVIFGTNSRCKACVRGDQPMCKQPSSPH
jgi:hypothetical protein